MALSDQDGNTHSHLRPEQQQDGRGMLGDQSSGRVEMPARGHWVGPRPGEQMPLEKPVSTLPAGPREYGKRLGDFDTEAARVLAHSHLRALLEHQPMVESQRRILVQALGVLDSFAS
jgi:hypothetical protein